MELLTADESRAWLRSRNLPVEGIVQASPAGARIFAGGAIGVLDVAGLASISRLAADWVTQIQTPTVLVFVFEYGIWPSSENHRLYELLLRSHGHAGWDVSRRPGHLFHANQRDDLTALLQISLIAGWGVIAAGENGYRALSFDHDRHFGFLGEDRACVEGMAGRLG